MCFYSEHPQDTLIKLILTKGSSGYNRHQFFAFGTNISLYNLNFYIEGSIPNTYDGITTATTGTVYFYNCLLRIKATSDYRFDAHEYYQYTWNFYNSQIISNYYMYGATAIQFYNSIYNKLMNCSCSNSYKDNTLNYNDVMTKIIKLNQEKKKTNIGLLNSDYQTWLLYNYLILQNDNYIISNGIFNSIDNSISKLISENKTDNLIGPQSLINNNNIDKKLNYKILKIK